MSPFEFVFTLFGLLLGLALAEGLGGLSKALKVRHRVRIGWLTALLGVFVSCDVVTFWGYGWALRDQVSASWPVLFGGFVVTAIYFVAASLVFPEHPEEWEDLDRHFFAQRRLVLGGALICNVALLAMTIALVGVPPFELRQLVITYSFFPVIGLAIMARRKAVVLASLAWLIALYPLSTVWG